MKKLLTLTAAATCAGLLAFACGKDDSKKGSGTDKDDQTKQGTLAIGYSTQNVPAINATMVESIPEEYQTGGTVQIATFLQSSGCFNRPSEPLGSETCAPPPSSSNILYLVWDENTTYCTDAKIASGECFEVWNSPKTQKLRFARPASIANPSICRENRNLEEDASVTLGSSVLSTVCRFENKLALNGKAVDKCSAASGTAVDLSEYIPWVADWSLPTTLKLQGSFGNEAEGAYYFGVNRDVTGSNGEYVIHLKNYGGGMMEMTYFDRTNGKIFHYMAGSAQDSPMRIAYLGDLPDASGNATGSFESIRMIRYKSGKAPHTTRMKSNGSYIWIQTWLGMSPGDSGFDPSNPSVFNDDQCLKLGENITSSIYVSSDECVTGFGKSTIAELNSESNYQLKLGVANIGYSKWFDAAASMNPDVNPMGEPNTCYN